MPELAEVAYFAKQWDAGRCRAVIAVHTNGKSRVFRDCDVPSLCAGLSGASLTKTMTRGKQMLFQFSGGHWLTVHLGMTGELGTKPQPFVPTRHDHLVLHTKDRALVFTDPRQFGSIRHHCGDKPPDAWLALPPQVLDVDFSVERLGDILLKHQRSPLKALLLDQRYFPGIGNWMADEVMWQLRLHPHTMSGSLDGKRIRALHRVLRKVCSTAMKTIGVDWSDPPRGWLFCYRWEKGHACPRCGTDLVREVCRGRTACWCPSCQEAGTELSSTALDDRAAGRHRA